MTNTKKDFADVMEEEMQVELEEIINEMPQVEQVFINETPVKIVEKTEIKEIAEKPKVRAGGKVKYLTIDDIESAFRLAQAFVMAGTIPECYKSGGKDANGNKTQATKEVQAARVLMAMQMGAEVGMPPMQSLQSIMIVNDRPALWGDAQLALVLNSGLCEKLEETIEGEEKTQMTATCKVMRKGIGLIERSFSWKEAASAGLTAKFGSLYDKYPKRMLAMRARAFALRDAFPDVLKGFTHSVEEVEQMIDITPVGKRAEIHAELANLETNNEVSEL